jgi:hypothetical protein
LCGRSHVLGSFVRVFDDAEIVVIIAFAQLILDQFLIIGVG